MHNVPPIPPEPLLLQTDEVAKRLRLKVPTVQKFIREGRLCAVKVGRAYLISEDDLRTFLRTSAFRH